MGGRRRIVARGLGALIGAALVGGGCGSALSRQELLAAGQEAVRVSPAPSGAAAADGSPSDAAARPNVLPGAGADTASPGITEVGQAVAAGSSPAGSGAASATAPGGTGERQRVPRGTVGRSSSPGSPARGPGSSVVPAGAAGSGSTGAGGTTTGGGGAGASSAAGDGAGTPGAVVNAEIRLGSFGTQTGPLGGILLPLVQGAKAWVADVNTRGGLAGHPVRLVMADDGGDPNRALALARRMVEQDKVHAFYAVHSPTALQAATPYLEQRQVPIVGVCECSPIGDDSPMVFHPGTGSKLGVYWAHLAPLLHYYPDKKKVAILYCREAATCAGIKDGMKPLGRPHGIEWVYEAQVSLAQPDFTAEVLAARNAGANAVIGIFDNASVIRMLRSAERQNWRPVVSSQQATYEDRFIRDGGDIINGVVVASNSAPYNTAPQLADYRAAMDRFVPGGIKSAFGGEMWGTGKLLETLARSFPAEPTAADFLAALYGLRGETVGGIFPPLAFRKGVGHGDTNPCVVPVKVEARQFVPASNDQFSCPPGWKPVQP